MSGAMAPQGHALPIKWGKVIDQTTCIGCHACTTACKSENEVPVGVTRTYVKSVDVGTFPLARRAFQVTRCNQCEDAPCVAACPTSAMFKRPDGIVDFAKSACIGCKACIAACPYDAIFINPEDHSAEKCNFCAHRLDVGLEPACVVVCPTASIFVGDLHDPSTRVAQVVQRHPVAVRRPEKDTQPKLFYRGAHQATLDPLAARRPDGGLFMWSEQSRGPTSVVSGHPYHANSSAAALLSYDVAHVAPWDWRVSLYTWSKSLASGIYLVAVLLVFVGRLDPQTPLWLFWTPIAAGAFLALTGLLLIGDLQHPERFYMIFTRPQWHSWLVRGAFIIAAYSVVLLVHFIAGSIGTPDAVALLTVVGVPLSIGTAVYTAYLFAQAKGRDLWQSALLPPHLAVQALLAGAAMVAAIAPAVAPDIMPFVLNLVAGHALLHLLFVGGETSLPHATAHARLAIWEMTRGRFRHFFRSGAVGVGLGLFAPWVGPPAALAVLAGLAAYEHAYVQAGQAVPLA